MTPAMRRLLRDLLADGFVFAPMHTGGYCLPSGRHVRLNTVHSLRLLGLLERDCYKHYILTDEGRRVAEREAAKS